MALESRKLRSILLGTDFSEHSRRAQECAVGLALRHGAHLTLVHVVDVGRHLLALPEAPRGLATRYQELAQERLDELEHEIGQRIANLGTRLLNGSASASLLAVATEIETDLLVVGTRGLSRLERVVLGSTAQRLIQHARCSVLTVPPGPLGDARPFDRVLVPTDFSEDALLALDRARGVVSGLRSPSILLLHVCEAPLLHRAYGLVSGANDSVDEERRGAAQRLASLAQVLSDLGGCSVETDLKEGHPAERILEVAAEQRVDLIAMGTHGRTGMTHAVLGSTAEKVAAGASVPLLTVSRRHDD